MFEKFIQNATFVDWKLFNQILDIGIEFVHNQVHICA